MLRALLTLVIYVASNYHDEMAELIAAAEATLESPPTSLDDLARVLQKDSRQSTNLELEDMVPPSVKSRIKVDHSSSVSAMVMSADARKPTAPALAWGGASDLDVRSVMVQ